MIPRADIIFATVALALTSCAAQHPAANDTDPTIVINAYRQGIAEAIQELRQNTPTIYTTNQASPDTDPETNYPYKFVGNSNSPVRLWLLLGHNDFIRGYIGAPLGPPVPH